MRDAWTRNMRFHLGDANAVGADVVTALAGAGVVLVDHRDRLRFVVRAAPHLRPDCVLLVHDYPPHGGPPPDGTHEGWQAATAAIGFERKYEEVQAVMHSTLAVFAPV